MAREYATRTLRELLRIIAARTLGMMVIFAVVVGSVAAASLLAPKWYRSEAEILARPEGVQDLLESPASLRDRVSLFVITQREILLSDAVVATALLRLDGTAMPQAGSIDGPTSPYLPWYSDQDIQDYVNKNVAKLNDVRKRLKVETPGGTDATFTQVLTVMVDWPEERPEAARAGVKSRQFAAKRAHDMAQYVVQAYLKRYLQLQNQHSEARVAGLSQDQLRKAQADMADSGRRLRMFIENEIKGDLPQLVAMSAQGTGIETGDAKLRTDFQGDLNRIDAEMADLSTLKRAVDAELAKGDGGKIVVPDIILATNPIVTVLQDSILKKKLTINTLATQYTEEYRELQNARADYAAALADLQVEMKKQSDRMQQKLDTLLARKTVLTKKVEDDRARTNALAAKVAQYQELQRDLQDKEAIYRKVNDQYLSAVASKKQAETKDFLVTELDQPSQSDPDNWRRPVIPLNIAIAALAGLILALVYAFLADHFDHSIKSVDDVEEYLGVPVVASVPKLGGRIIVNE